MRFVLALVLVAGCSEKKSNGDKPSRQAHRKVPAAGCDAKFDELLAWADTIVEFKTGYDRQYIAPRPNPEIDVKWHLTRAGLIRINSDPEGKESRSEPIPYDQVDTDDFAKRVKLTLIDPAGFAVLDVDDATQWQAVVHAAAAARRLGFERVAFAVPAKAEIPAAPEPSPIRRKLVELANQDDRVMEEKDGPVLAMTFEHCPAVKDPIATDSRSRIARYTAFVDHLKTEMKACECRADLAEVKEILWARAMLSPFVKRGVNFWLHLQGAEPEVVSFLADEPWKTVLPQITQKEQDIGDAVKPVKFDVKK